MIIDKKYGDWNLLNPTENDDFAYYLYLIETKNKYNNNILFLSQQEFTFMFYDYDYTHNSYYIKATKEIRKIKLKKLNLK